MHISHAYYHFPFEKGTGSLNRNYQVIYSLKTVHTTMQIFIKTLIEKTIVVDVAPSDTIGDVKRKLRGLNDGPADGLMFAGKHLEDNRMLRDYGIHRESTLFSVLGLRGGTDSHENYSTLEEGGTRGLSHSILQRTFIHSFQGKSYPFAITDSIRPDQMHEAERDDIVKKYIQARDYVDRHLPNEAYHNTQAVIGAIDETTRQVQALQSPLGIAPAPKGTPTLCCFMGSCFIKEDKITVVQRPYLNQFRNIVSAARRGSIDAMRLYVEAIRSAGRPTKNSNFFSVLIFGQGDGEGSAPRRGCRHACVNYGLRCKSTSPKISPFNNELVYFSQLLSEYAAVGEHGSYQRQLLLNEELASVRDIGERLNASWKSCGRSSIVAIILVTAFVIFAVIVGNMQAQ